MVVVEVTAMVVTELVSLVMVVFRVFCEFSVIGERYEKW